MIFLFEIDRKDIAENTGASKRAVDRALNRMWEEVGKYWQDKMLPRHFEQGAAERYGYQSRSEKYKKRKASKFRRGLAAALDIDLVMTGRSREDLSRPAAIRAYPTRFTLTMRATRSYFRMRPYKSRHPAMGEEVTRVTEPEQSDLASFAKKRLPQLIEEENSRTRTRKRL